MVLWVGINCLFNLTSVYLFTEMNEKYLKKLKRNSPKSHKELVFARSSSRVNGGAVADLRETGQGWRLIPAQGSSPIVGVTREHRR